MEVELGGGVKGGGGGGGIVGERGLGGSLGMVSSFSLKKDDFFGGVGGGIVGIGGKFLINSDEASLFLSAHLARSLEV